MIDDNDKKAVHRRLQSIDDVLKREVGYRQLPKGAESIDWRRVCEIEKNTTTETLLLDFTSQRNDFFHFTGYNVYTDSQFVGDVQFFFRINGARILRWHGDPSNDFVINLGLGPDLSSLIPTETVLKPGQRITIGVVNNNAELDIPMGYRLSGFVDRVNKFDDGSFGG